MTTEASREATQKYRQTEKGQAVFRAAKKRYEASRREAKAEYQRVRRQAFADFLNDLKDVPCLDCGGRFPAVAMDFDHVRGDKVKAVSLMAFFSRQKVLDEIAKCEIVCSNCHRVRTLSRLNGAQ